MIKSITITNFLDDSITITLDDPEPEHGLMIQSIEGLGPPHASVNTTTLATMDGSIFNSSKIEERIIILTLRLTESENGTIEDARQLTYRYCPIKKPLIFEVKTDNRTVQTVGYVASNEPDIFSENETVVISITCPSSYWETKEETITTFSGIEPVFEFEFSNESTTQSLLEFGDIQTSKERNIYYEGDSEVGVTITIHVVEDEVQNVSIYNTETREAMKILTSKLPDGKFVAADDLIICTVKGSKKIQLLRDGEYTNVLNCLDKDSDWFLLNKGANLFAYTADYGMENIEFSVANKVLYAGV